MLIEPSPEAEAESAQEDDNGKDFSLKRVTRISFPPSGAELAELELSHQMAVRGLAENQPKRRYYVEFKNIILLSYGKRLKMERGSSKMPLFAKSLNSSEAYSAFHELVTNMNLQ
jgi:hypothetical protein